VRILGLEKTREGAMAADITLNEKYAVAIRDVYLTVTIGEGQQGRSSVLLNAREILRTSPPIGALLLGPGPDLASGKLTVRTVVNDVVATTNRMSVTYKLSDGKSSEEFISNGRVASENDYLIFEANFSFVQEERT
jgi:hypothetical protein